MPWTWGEELEWADARAMKRRGVERMRDRVAELSADLSGRILHRRVLTTAKDRLLERGWASDTWAMFCDREKDWEPLLTAMVPVGRMNSKRKRNSGLLQ